MKFSIKDLRFLVEAIDARVQVLVRENTRFESEGKLDEAADCGNDIEFYRYLRAEIAGKISEMTISLH